MKSKLKKLKQNYIDHYNLLVLSILNSSEPSEKEEILLKQVINALLKIIDNQRKIIEKLKTKSLVKEECLNLLKSQTAKLDESLNLLKNIHINKNKLSDLISDFELLYDEEKSFYSEFL